MCGILGLTGRNKNYSSEQVTSLLQKIQHRGPDNTNILFLPNNFGCFGHVRLSVLDLSESANQPMQSLCRRYVIVYNGELYNFVSVRESLRIKGYKFITHGDTEVILAAYREWGEDCVNHFNGMFSFAIYDHGNLNANPSLFFARDRAGEKPFYYTCDSSGFSFASEVKALPSTKVIDENSLNFYLTLGYVPDSMCLFQDIHKLPPAHYGRYDLISGCLNIKPYWSIPASNAPISVDGMSLAEEAGALIEDSVRLRMVADVPVGVLLSGGLDSSLVTAAAARVSSFPIETFTITLPGSSLDEAQHAKKVASYFGTRHHELPLDRPSLNMLDSFASLIDEPIADSSILPSWLVFGMARKNVTVALGGDGGDELFGGYASYKTVLEDQARLKYLPNKFLQCLSKVISQLPAGVRGRNKLASLSHGPLYQFVYGTPYFDLTLRNRLLNQSKKIDINLNAPEEFLTSLFNDGANTLDKMTRVDFKSVLPDDFLVKVDRASMAHSLEVRAPMLDHRLIEFAFSKVPSSWKVENGETRRLQRLLAQKWLPADLDTKRKQGFSIPINEWLRAEDEKNLMKRMEGLPDLINMDEVRNLVRGHLTGRSNGGRLFALIMLAIAMRNKTQ